MPSLVRAAFAITNSLTVKLSLSLTYARQAAAVANASISTLITRARMMGIANVVNGECHVYVLRRRLIN